MMGPPNLGGRWTLPPESEVGQEVSLPEFVISGLEKHSKDGMVIRCVVTWINAPYKPKPSWRTASKDQKEQYKILLENRLNSIVIPTMVSECDDVHCQDPVHKEALDWLTTELLEGVQDCAEATLPVPETVESKGRKPTPGFKAKVKPFKDIAYKWHQLVLL